MFGSLIRLAEALGSVPVVPTVLIVAIAVLLVYSILTWRQLRLIEARAREDRAMAEARAREDRERNERDHDRLFVAVSSLQATVASLQATVSDLKADVRVLLERTGGPAPKSSSPPESDQND